MSGVAIVAGSSGVVGTALLHQLCANRNFTEVRIFVRRSSGVLHPKLKEFIVDFDHINDHKEKITGDVFFSCMGSTKKKTPDKRLYYQIDHDYPVHMARLALDNGVSQFHIISAIGANAKASNFYLKMKGETERDIAGLSFGSVHIYRPSLITGNRDENRIGETIANGLFKIINPLFVGKLRKYRSIEAKDIAKAMVAQAMKNLGGVHYYESDAIQAIADKA